MTTYTATLPHSGSLLQRWFQRWTPPAARDARAEALKSAAEEAASVRALADTYRNSDPSFASDLYAAADRHEHAAERAALRG
jgi:hypothetical protein